MTARLIMYTTTFCGPCQRLKVQLGDASIEFDDAVTPCSCEIAS